MKQVSSFTVVQTEQLRCTGQISVLVKMPKAELGPEGNVCCSPKNPGEWEGRKNAVSTYMQLQLMGLEFSPQYGISGVLAMVPVLW